MAADDAACPVLPCSRIAWSCLTYAHARLLTRGGDPVDLLHDALVASSHAVTVLVPRNPERTTYGLRIAWTVLDGTDLDPALNALELNSLRLSAPGPGPVGTSRNATASIEVERLLAERGFDASPRWLTRSSLRTAGALVSADVDDPETFEKSVSRLWTRDLTDSAQLDLAERAVATMWEHAAQAWRRRSAAPPLAPHSPYVGRARF